MTEKARKPKKSVEDKIAALQKKQADLKSQIARQKKLAAEREARAIELKLVEAGKAVQSAGLLDLSVEDLKALLQKAVGLKG